MATVKELNKKKQKINKTDQRWLKKNLKKEFFKKIM